jgi:hypothetical protein
MSRGGAREGAGRKSTWPSGCKFAETKLIRVPERLAEQLLDIARLMDAGLNVEQDIFSCELPETGQVSVNPRSRKPEVDSPISKPHQRVVVTTPLFEIVTEPNDRVQSLVLEPLTSSQLLKRFGLKSRGTLNDKKKRCYPDNPAEFHRWSGQKDPDGVSWDYHESDNMFHPF